MTSNEYREIARRLLHLPVNQIVVDLLCDHENPNVDLALSVNEACAAVMRAYRLAAMLADNAARLEAEAMAGDD
jgi:hypothetical protein